MSNPLAWSPPPSYNSYSPISNSDSHAQAAVSGAARHVRNSPESVRHRPQQSAADPSPISTRKPTSACCGKAFLYLVIAFLFALFSILHSISDYNNTDRPAVRDRIRREWHEEVLQHEKDNERRIRAALFWRDLTPKPECIRYDTREWTAELVNVPSWKDGLKWCHETPVVIHGKTYPKADYCSVQNGRTYGHWAASGSEPSCKPLFENYRDTGCVVKGSRHRRVEAPLANLRPEDGDNWREMCTSTPADLYGFHFDSPDHCMHWGQWGVWGAWIIEDGSC